jgi:hypothetical protein
LFEVALLGDWEEALRFWGGWMLLDVGESFAIFILTSVVTASSFSREDSWAAAGLVSVGGHG